ncbi:TetR/AcrR family transcriptional regulator [Streptomyces tsukubensis]|uniref:TetR/AcrR family transcriptional regulator n=1 Tax=Streptomyces tsukubensis TaxID=83656 RepID=UPI002118723A|nr:TetR/AcrR family transcriptional regulator [Streptomyces tsukubensis]
MTRKPRVDAELNRLRIIAVARAAFAGEGLDLPMREIARRAGLGIATVHRHFPARSDLVTAALAELVAECRGDMRASLDEPDPWRALSGVVHGFAKHRLRDRGLNEALFGSHPAAAAFAVDRREQARAMEQLVARAREAGAVRPDVTVEDVRVCLGAIASFRLGHSATDLQRLVELLLIGLAADASASPERGARRLRPRRQAIP